MRTKAIEFNDSAAKTPGFYLNTIKPPFEVNGDIISPVLTERQKQREPDFDKRRNNARFRDIAHEFGVTQK